MKNVFAAFIILSFLSFPNASELGLEKVSLIYLSLFAIILILIVISRLFIYNNIRLSFRYVVMLLAPLVYIIFSVVYSCYTGVQISDAVNRGAHIFLYCILLIGMYIYNDINYLKIIAFTGLVEVLAVLYIIIFYNGGFNVLNRATDIDGMNVSSILTPFWFFYVAKLKVTKLDRNFLLYIWFFSFVIILFTQSRALIVSCALSSLLFLKGKNLFYILLLLMLSIPFLNDLDLFSRFNTVDDANMITVLSKVEEIDLLWSWFLDSPLIGKGLGTYFQISSAGSAYNYSHNMFMFYLGYTGIIGFILFLTPLFILVKRREFLLLSIIIVFYTSSTSFTNIKHSILFAFISMFYYILPKYKINENG
jgi:hypothetical protein